VNPRSVLGRNQGPRRAFSATGNDSRSGARHPKGPRVELWRHG